MKNYLLYTKNKDFGNEIMYMIRRKINPTTIFQTELTVRQIVNQCSKWTLMTEYKESALCGETFDEIYVDNDIDQNSKEYKLFRDDAIPRVHGFRGFVFMDFTEEGLFLEML